MGKSWYRLASTLFFAIACLAGIVWCAMLIRSYVVYAQLAATLADESLYGALGSSFLMGSEIAVLVGGIVWGVVAAIMGYLAWRAWKTKWGKRQGTVIIAIIALAAMWIVGGWAYWGLFLWY